jgi:hypothetical protein
MLCFSGACHGPICDIASNVLTQVKTFFEGVEFKNQPDKVREYVHWALQHGGPVYYEKPIPMLHMLMKDVVDFWSTRGSSRQLQVCVPCAQPQACFEQAQINFWASLRGDDLFLSLTLSKAFSI